MIVVYAYVCADLIHRGHLEHMKNCRALGDKLVVGVLTDEAIMEEKEKPIMSFNERVDLVRSFSYVDVVLPQTTYSPENNIVGLHPDILVESSSHPIKLIDRIRTVCEREKIRLMIVPYYPGHSSSGVKDKVCKESIRR